MAVDYNDYALSIKEKRKYLLGSYLLIFCIAYLFYDSISAAVLSGTLAFAGIDSYKNYLRDKRKAVLKNQFRDLLYSLSSSFASGRQITESIGEAILNLEANYDRNSPIMIETKRMYSSLHDARASEEAVLSDFAMRSGIKDIINFVDVYIICRTTGGNLERAVMESSRILMEKIEIDEEIRVMTVQKKFEGRIICLMPLGVILFLRLASPDYMQVMYESVAGRIVMTISLACLAYAGYLIKKITDIEV